LWAAYRFGPCETAAAGVLLGALAIRATLAGSGPFVAKTPNESMVLLQAYLAVTVLMTLVLAASVRTRREVEGRVRELNDELERVVEQRTAELRASNQELQNEVAERRRTAIELARSEARLIEAQHIARIGSWEWDMSADRVWWSSELYRIYGIAPEEFTADYSGFAAHLHPDDRERTEAIVREALAAKGPFAFEHRIVRKDGGVRTLQAMGEVLVDSLGNAIGMRGTAQDITERKQAESEREQLAREQSARREAEEANRAKDQFLAVLSHELRTPLNAIVGWSQLLSEGGLDPDTAKNALETIVRNANAQTKIISDVLDVSRIVSGKVELEMKDVELHGLVSHVVTGFEPAAQARGTRLEVVALPATVRGDPVRLQQVVGNLLANAIKFAPAASGRVELHVRPIEDDVEIVVQDNGPGISPDFLPHVFDRFRQGDSSTTRRHGGLGLGLAIVRHLVELHGGRVAARNRIESTGAVITVTLPQRRDARTHAAPSTPERSRSVTPSLAGIRVLVVDDEADARVVMRKMLEIWGASVETAGSVAEAIELVQRRVPDLVLTDIGMPAEDGYTLLQRVRLLPADKGGRVPVAAVTAYASAEDRRKLLLAGFAMHITKPVEAGELVRAVLALARASA
jgi:PAS domain S-box-containing protein